MIKFTGQDFDSGRQRTIYLSDNAEFAYEPYNDKHNLVISCAGIILVTTPMEELLKLAVAHDDTK